MLRISLLVLVGTVGGALLGEMTAGSRLTDAPAAGGSYTRLSANPDAAAPQTIDAAPCRGCPDSYGVAARQRAERENRMDNAFRALGAVGSDPTASEDDYRYGGRFVGRPGRTSDADIEPIETLAIAEPEARSDQPDVSAPIAELDRPSAEVP